MRKPGTAAMLTLLLLALGRECVARKWFDLADPSIYMAGALDPGRIEYTLERDPFNFAAEPPTFAPTLEPQQSAVSPTAAPTMIPTEVASESPTGQPTAKYMFLVGNGGCATGKTLFEIRMEDSWGDGWGEIMMNITELSQTEEEAQGTSAGDVLVLEGEETVSMSQSVQKSSSARSSKTVFSGSLSHGDQAYKYVCLDLKKCYSVHVGAGLWEDEVKWEIRQAELGVPKENWYNGEASAKGLAPTNCQFSVPDPSSKEFPCPVTCGETTEASTLAPSESPSLLPSFLGSDSSTSDSSTSVSPVSS